MNVIVMKCGKYKTDTEVKFKPNRGRYLVLLCAFIVITGACFGIAQESTWFAILAGLGSGGFSSTLVAWLIAESDSKKTLEQTKENRKILFNKLSSAFNYGLQILVLHTEKHLKDESPRKWHEWNTCAYRFVADDPDFCHDYLISMRIFIDDIADEIYALESQSAIMLEYGLMNSSDIEALSLMLTMCDLIKCELRSNNGEAKIADNVNNHCNMIHAAIDCAPALKFINDSLIEPTIYTLAKRAPDQED